MNLEHAEDDGKNVGVDAGLGSRRAPPSLGSEVDEVGLEESVPEEAVVGTLPQGRGEVMLGLSLAGVCDVKRVGKVHGPGLDEALEQVQELVLIVVVNLSFAEGEELGRDNLVHHMAPEAADWLRFGDDDDVLICNV